MLSMRHSQLIEDPCRLIHLRSAIWTVTWCSNSSLLVCVPRKTLKSKALSVVKSNFDFVFFWWLTVFYFLDQRDGTFGESFGSELCKASGLWG